MSAQQLTVYVIDDDESVRRSFARLFRLEKWNVQTFATLDEFFADARIVENACILTDLRMPGATGFDVAKRLSSGGIKIPLIIISATDDHQTRERARLLGAVSFFHKPVDHQALLDAVWWAVNSKAEVEQ